MAQTQGRAVTVEKTIVLTMLDKIPDTVDPKLARTVDRLAGVMADIARRIARGGIDENLAADLGTNADGDAQKALDVIADDEFRAALIGSDVGHYASEEQDSVVTLNPGGALALAIDPLDGSSNIDTNVSIGTLFGIGPAAQDPRASFLRQGQALMAAGYAIYGPQCCLVVTFGQGVLKYVLDPKAQRFRLVQDQIRIPVATQEYAINASNQRHWPAPVRAYVTDRLAGAEGPLARNYNTRWIASLVAEAHRILTRGGVFLYPSDRRKGYEKGRLRLVYECAPMAMLIEQAGGRATDGVTPIARLVPDHLHDRTPFVFGSAQEVDAVARYVAAAEAQPD